MASDSPGERVFRRALLSGSVASITSTAALACCGKAELDDPAAPLNGPSQWVWGRHAKYRDGFSARHTLVGYGIHHAASVMWACLFEALRRRQPGRTVVAAATTAATAAFVDFALTPPRFTPGFEKRLSTSSLVMVYAAFAAGLWLAARKQ